MLLQLKVEIKCADGSIIAIVLDRYLNSHTRFGWFEGILSNLSLSEFVDSTYF